MTIETMKKWLQEIIDIETAVMRINSADFRAEAVRQCTTAGMPPNPYPAMLGSLEGSLAKPVINAKIILENIGGIERLERIASAFESLDIDLSDESLKALELMNTRDYRDQQRTIRNAVNGAIREVQETERDYEHDKATDALVEAGFFPDESGDYFDRDNYRVTIELISGRECRYAWELQDNSSGEQVTVDSGKSGEFSRLLSAISPAVQDAV